MWPWGRKSFGSNYSLIFLFHNFLIIPMAMVLKINLHHYKGWKEKPSIHNWVFSDHDIVFAVLVKVNISTANLMIEHHLRGSSKVSQASSGQHCVPLLLPKFHVFSQNPQSLPGRILCCHLLMKSHGRQRLCMCMYFYFQMHYLYAVCSGHYTPQIKVICSLLMCLHIVCLTHISSIIIKNTVG